MTAQALTVVAESAPVVSAEQLELVRRTIAKDATPEELRLYLYDCARQGVHPLDKLLHFTKRGGKYTPVTSIDLMRMRASETGEYVGNDAYEFTGTPGKPGFTATARVWRLVHGQRVSFTRAARWEEFVPASPGDHMYRRMPHVMLGKVAEAQALRAGFPRQLHGLYADEEIPQALPVENAPARRVEKSRRAPVENPEAQPVEKSGLITAAQRKTLIDTARTHGWTDDQLRTFLEECGYESTKEIPAEQYDALLQALERGRTVDELEEGG